MINLNEGVLLIPVQHIRDIIESIILIIGIPMVLIQIYLLKKQLKYQSNWDKKNVTFEYIDKYTHEIDDINKKIIKDLRLLGQAGGSISEKKLKELLKDTSFRTDIMKIVAYFDHLALGIKNDYFSYEIAENSLSIMAHETYRALIPYFKLREKEIGPDVANHFRDLLENYWIKE